VNLPERICVLSVRRQMKKLTSIIAGLLLFALVFAATSCSRLMHRPPPLPEQVELHALSVSVPMDLFAGRPVVSVRINGKGPFSFILDTGAAGSVVSPDLARELGLPDKGQTLAGRPGAAAPVQATVTRIDRLDLGEAQVSGLFAVELELSSLLKGSQAPRGVLSAASFPGLLVTFDYPARRVALRRGELAPADGQSILGWEGGDRVPSVFLTFSDLKLKVDLDSGSSSGISLPRQYANVLRLTGKPVAASQERTVDGAREVTVATFDGAARLGRFTIDNPQIRFVDGIPFGNIGSAILQRFAMTLDSKNRRIQFEPAPLLK
jgi:hypothetical protein